MNYQANFEKAIHETLSISKRLAFVIIFLVVQLYSLLVQAYLVSQEILPPLKKEWQVRLLRYGFLNFLKKKPPQNDYESGALLRPSPKRTGNTNHIENGSESRPESRHENDDSENGLFNATGGRQFMDDNGPSWTSPWVLLNTVAMFILGLALSVPTFNHLREIQDGINPQCTIDMDGDIAGVGVRAALWVQQGWIWVSVTTGPFLDRSQRPTGVKELAAGLIITHLSLAIAILVQMRQQTLSPLDAAIGVMLLDAQSLALAVSFSSREILAARWEVVMVSLAQVLGMVVIGVVVARFDHLKFAGDECDCFSFFWWAWQSSCFSPSLPLAEGAIFWVYYTFRWLSSLQNWHFSMRYMWEFNILERTDKWDDVPATAGTLFLQSLIFGMVSSIYTELAIAAYDPNPPASLSVGQITGIVIAGTTILRASWLFFRRFVKVTWPEEGETTEGVGLNGTGRTDLVKGATSRPSRIPSPSDESSSFDRRGLVTSSTFPMYTWKP
ncbi:hypothetical protein B0H63DRAFT_540257 [Podospora didyma]|uniref:Uncharacterized protein n=1 Tax=Podospora didyma TaxID=330526 RepID=A0AAE0U0G1_9PEZI|nr:hypothetical protein B0H63DRAFT_540257 [Podospora didyma]